MPWQGTHIAFPTQLDMFARGTHQFVGHGLIGYGELQLVGMQPLGALSCRLESGLDDFIYDEYVGIFDIHTYEMTMGDLPVQAQRLVKE